MFSVVKPGKLQKVESKILRQNSGDSVLTCFFVISKGWYQSSLFFVKPQFTSNMKWSNMWDVNIINLSTSHYLVNRFSPPLVFFFFFSVGLFKSSYDSEWRVCDLERLVGPAQAGRDGLPGVRCWASAGEKIVSTLIWKSSSDVDSYFI